MGLPMGSVCSSRGKHLVVGGVSSLPLAQVRHQVPLWASGQQFRWG